MFWLLLFLLLCVLFYKYFVKPLNYWKQQNVPHQTPWPMFGNMTSFIFKKDTLPDKIKKLYNHFPDERYCGIYQFNTPNLLIRDLELIKQIAVKDSDNFVDRRKMIDETVDPFFSKNLFNLRGQKWRDMRATLSPAFTSSKMKWMFELMSDCSERLTDHFLKMNEEVIVREMKDVFTKYTNDVIASTAFGISCDSLSNPNNEFYQMGKGITIGGLRMIFSIFMPTVSKILRMQLFPKAAKFFTELVSQTLKVREENHIIRSDMIHLLMEAKKGRLKYEEDHSGSRDTGFATVEESQIGRDQKQQLKEITDLDIAAQALLFFFAGFDSASTVMAFMAHELAVNMDVQEKLQQEIDETCVDINGKITYEVLVKMKYLDMVVSETLRKWTPGTFTDRFCRRDYDIKPTGGDERVLVVKEGTIVMIPIIGIHYDPKYFPDPDKFDPERFSDENKGNIVPYSYMPFGIGPRNCIGSRFALLEIKIMIFHLLSKFTFVVVGKTSMPIKLAPRSLTLSVKDGFWLGLKKR